MYDVNTLRDIFYSSQHTYSSDKTLLVKLLFLLSKNYLQMEKLTFCKKSHYLQLASDIKTRENCDAAGGSPQHIALKLIAREYLETLNVKVKFEFPFCGYIPDVISSDLKIVIECGHTDNVDKLFTYFTQGDISECIQLPYPDSDDHLVHGYKLIPMSGLTEFLEEESKDDAKTILNIINRNH